MLERRAVVALAMDTEGVGAVHGLIVLVEAQALGTWIERESLSGEAGESPTTPGGVDTRLPELSPRRR
jgi:hypothetical protein